LSRLTRGVSYSGLAIYIKNYPNAKEDEFNGNSNISLVQKYNLQKIL
jgi:hypothetical protein